MYYSQSVNNFGSASIAGEPRSPGLPLLQGGWSTTVPTSMPWAPPPSPLMRFTSSPSYAPPPYTQTTTHPTLPVYPGDPCTSGLKCSTIPSTSVATGQSFPSTSYQTPRCKRKMQEETFHIRQKQLITEKIVEQMHELSLTGNQPNPQHPYEIIFKSRFVESDMENNNEDDCSSKESEEVEEVLKEAEKVVLSDELKQVVSSPTVEQRLAIEVAKKSALAVMLWQPPKRMATCHPSTPRREASKRPREESGLDDMEM